MDKFCVIIVCKDMFHKYNVVLFLLKYSHYIIILYKIFMPAVLCFTFYDNYKNRELKTLIVFSMKFKTVHSVKLYIIKSKMKQVSNEMLV